MTTVVQVTGRIPASVRTDRDRAQLAGLASALRALPDTLEAIRVDIGVEPARFVDLDSLLEVVVRGLRVAGRLPAGARQLVGVIATRSPADAPRVAVAAVAGVEVADLPPPGPVAAEVTTSRPPRPAVRNDRRALRDKLAREWGDRGVLDGPVWAEMQLSGQGSLLTPMEPTLDALEPVLGRDPRGQPRQEFFPADDRIVWLRLARVEPGPVALRLRLGPVQRALR